MHDGNAREVGQTLEAYRRYLLLVANKEIAPALRSKGGASDLVQETFLEAHRDLGQFSGRSPDELKGWLRRILRNNLANFARRYQVSGKRRVGREVALDGQRIESSTLSPDEEAIRREEAERIKQALSRLSERDQLVLTWHNEDHCDWSTIGLRIGGTADKARKIWTRALKRLAKEVADLQESSLA